MLEVKNLTASYRGVVAVRAVDIAVPTGQTVALLGPNGAGKSTLLTLAGALRHPSGGTVSVLGERLGRTDLRALRTRVGMVATTVRLPGWMTAGAVVRTGATGTVQQVRDDYTPAQLARADELMGLLGITALADREVGVCSQGERQRVRIARALMADPALLVLDEPFAGLDLPAREILLAALAALAAQRPALATVLVAHHLEELPATTTHALLLRDGTTVASGPAGRVLTDGPVSACFGLPVRVHRHDDGRWSARANIHSQSNS